MDGPEGEPKQMEMFNRNEPDKTRVKKGNGSKRGKKTSRRTTKTEGKQLPLPIDETSKEIVNPPNPPNSWCTSRDCPYARADTPPAKSADNPPAATNDNNPRSVV